jgi:hypothetical protein
VTINSDDLDEAAYDFAIQGTGGEPEVNVTGQGLSIADGDTTPQVADGTDFETFGVTTSAAKQVSFVIENTGDAALNVSSIDISGAHAGDFTAASGYDTVVSPSGSTIFQLIFQPSAAGTRNATVTVNTNDADEAAYDFAVTGLGDTTVPTVLSVTRLSPTDEATNADALTFQVAFSEDVQLVDVADFEATGTTATAASVSSVSDSVYDVTISGGDLAGLDGTVGLTVIDTGYGIRDLQYNPLENGTPSGANESYSVDNTAPTAALSSTASDPTTGAFTLDVAFSESVTGLAAADFTVTNGAASALTGSGDAYAVTITPAGDGTVTVELPADSAADDAGNGNSVSNTFSIENDETAPTVTLSSSASDPTAGAFTLDIVFSESVTGLADADFAVTNGAASALTGSGDTYALTITPAADGTVTVELPADTAVDGAGNGNAISNTFTIENDETAPTVTLSTSDADPTSGAFTLDVVFSESVTGLVDGDFSVTNGAASGLSGSGDAYTVTITPAADGTVSVELPADSAEDGAGNGNAVSSLFSIEADLTAPTVLSIVRQAPAASPTNADSLTFRVTFSEDVANVDGGDFAPAGTTATASVATVSASIYDVTVSGGDLAGLDGTVSLGFAVGQDVADLVGNALVDTSPSGADESYTVDNAAPTVALTTTDPDPTKGVFTLAVDFSETVSGLAEGDFVVTNGSAAGLSGSGDAYTVMITPASNGTVTVELPAGAATDAAGNDNAVSGLFSIEADLEKPTVSLSSAAADPTSGAFTLDVVFSEAVTGLEDSDFVVTNGSAAAPTGSGTTYAVDITPTADGTVTVELPADSAFDTAGNGASAAVPFTIENDETEPTIVLSTLASDPVTGEFTLEINFSETVTGLADTDFTVTNGTTGTFTGSGDAYELKITPDADGTVSVELPADSAADDAGNGNAVSNAFSIEADITVPTVLLSSAAADPTSGVFTLDVVFSEPVTGLEAADFVVTNGSAAAPTGSGTTYEVDITPAADGTVTVRLPAGSATDGANGAAESNLFSIENDESAPTVVLSSTDADPTSGVFTVDVVFSEAVTGLAAGDFTVTNASSVDLTGSGQTYELDVTPAADGTVTVELPAGSAQDTAGNDNTQSNLFSIENDETAPTVTLSSTATGPVTAAFSLDIAFSEDVTGFSLADVAVSNATASSFTGAGASYAVTITPAGAGAITVDVPSASAEDAAGNDNLAAAQFSIQSDAVAPGVASISGSPDPITDGDAGAGGFTLTTVFSEAMDTSVHPTIGFPSEDPSATLTANAGAWTSATTYVQDYDVTDVQDVIAGVDVSVSGARDAVGNTMAASTTADVFSIDMPGGGIVLEVASIGGDGTFDFNSALAALDGAIATSGGAGSVSTSNVAPGTYDVTQLAPSGFELTDLACVDPDGGSVVSLTSGSASIDLDNLETVTCTFTNTVQGQVSVAVTTLGQDGAFDFTGGLGPFTVTTSANAGATSFSEVDSGAYDIVFAGLDGFELTDLSCTGDADASVDLASGTASIDLDAGESVSCEFEATSDPQLSVPSDASAALTLPYNFADVTSISTTIPLSNIGGAPASFTAAVDEPWFSVTPTSGVLQPGETIDLIIAFTEEAAALAPGGHAGMLTIINETGGFSTASAGATSAIQAVGGAITIPVAATIDPREGVLTIAARTGPQPAAGDASFTYASPAPDLRMSLTTTDGHAASSALDLVYGNYVLSQSAPEGWRLDAIACEGDADGGSVIDLAAQQVTIDLDPEEEIVCTFANVMDEAYVIAQTQSVISSFMALRADQILEASPDLGDRLRSRGAGAAGFTAEATEGRQTASVSYSLADLRNAQTDERWAAASGVEAGSLGRTGDWRDGIDVWLQANYAKIEDDRAGLDEDAHFGAVFVGADYLLKDNLLAGAIAQFDWAATEGGTLGSSASGAGWLFGPYLVANLNDGLYADVRGAWGRSNNYVSPFGTYEDRFDTERFLIEANLSGDLDFGGYRLSPDAGVAYFDETQEAYTDSLGIRIPEQTLEILRLRTGGELAYRFEQADGGYYEPYLSLRGIYDFDPASVSTGAGRIDFNDVRAAAGAGISARFANGSTFEAAVSFDGVGAGDYGAATGRFQFTVPFGAGAGQAGAGRRSDTALAGGWGGVFGDDDYSFGPYGLEQRGGLAGFR